MITIVALSWSEQSVIVLRSELVERVIGICRMNIPYGMFMPHGHVVKVS